MCSNKYRFLITTDKKAWTEIFIFGENVEASLPLDFQYYISCFFPLFIFVRGILLGVPCSELARCPIVVAAVAYLFVGDVSLSPSSNWFGVRTKFCLSPVQQICYKIKFMTRSHVCTHSSL